MSFVEDIKPKIEEILLLIPTAIRPEMADAITDAYGFEEWRVQQDPVVDDTPANRLDYASGRMAWKLREHLAEILYGAREREAEALVRSDLDGGA